MNRFLEEVREMPCALRRLADYYAGEGHRNLLRFAEIADGCGEIIFAGMGSSESAPLAILPGLSAAGVKGAHGGSIGIRIADAGEWLHYGTAAAPSALAVLVSQSGESFETRALAERGFVSSYVAITNNEHSSLAARANLTLPLCAGDEASVSNKTYANTLAVLYLLSAVLRRKPIEAALEELRSTADRLHALDECAVEAAAQSMAQTEALAFVGRGPAYAAARQCALTFIEGAKMLCAAFSGGAFRHGPVEALGPRLGLVVLAPSGKTQRLVERLASDAAASQARVVCVSDGLPSAIPGVMALCLPPALNEELFPIAVSGLQNLLLYHLCLARGLEPGVLIHCEKITACE